MFDSAGGAMNVCMCVCLFDSSGCAITVVCVCVAVLTDVQRFRCEDNVNCTLTL